MLGFLRGLGYFGATIAALIVIVGLIFAVLAGGALMGLIFLALGFVALLYEIIREIFAPKNTPEKTVR